ncbi:hypothetical protein ACNFJ7_15195 [Sphingomonas sp. HT-1]|uniref:hypothetical protein n=1 Tax=unclassified Sphingomonas TaxID=196159 RepID=UPI0002D61764|nr:MULTISPECIES: hypothetical protein [unclassified Sphingomonas]KTF69894.1 hypothetical protein ATB93_06375 [Sphingomonas sp. WG]
MTEDQLRTNYWFRPRLLGIVSVPVTWQGWTAVLVYLVLAAWIVLRAVQGSAAQVWLLAPLTIFAWLFCFWHTDGGWRCRE